MNQMSQTKLNVLEVAVMKNYDATKKNEQQTTKMQSSQTVVKRHNARDCEPKMEVKEQKKKE